MNLIEPNIFKMRLNSEMPKWKQFVWKTFGKRSLGVVDGYYCEGYWLRGVCLITKCEPNE